MDIELLSKMLEELLLDHDTVGLPGLGTFVAEVVPASFSDRGYTINPPYRRLSFVAGNPSDDTLAMYYAQSNNRNRAEAETIIAEYSNQIKAVLMERRIVVFPGLGRLRTTRDDNVFFVADEDLDIYPDGIALEPVSLKTHMEAPEDLSFTVSSLRDIIVPAEPQAPAADAEPAPAEPQADAAVREPAPGTAEPTLEPAAEEQPAPQAVPDELPAAPAEPVVPEPAAAAPAEPVAVEPVAAEPAPAEPEEPARPRSRWWLIPVLVMAIAVLALAAFLVLARVAPGFIDTILYTPEELSIINYEL